MRSSVPVFFSALVSCSGILAAFACEVHAASSDSMGIESRDATPMLPPAPNPAFAPLAQPRLRRPDVNDAASQMPSAPVTAQCSVAADGDVRCVRTPVDLTFTRRETEKTWYGWQTILSDSTALAMAGSAPFTKSVGTAMASLGVYMLIPPLVHVFHGHGGRAERSLGLRVGMPFAGALFVPLMVFGYGASHGERKLCSGNRDCGEQLLVLAGVGGVAGLLGAMVMDALSAYDERVVETKVVRRVSVAPSVSIEPGGAKLALAGTF